jgi:hypothetical protein
MAVVEERVQTLTTEHTETTERDPGTEILCSVFFSAFRGEDPVEYFVDVSWCRLEPVSGDAPGENWTGVECSI